MTIRALIVDDETIARDGIREWLRHESDFEVVGEANDGPSAVRAIQRLEPDVAFLDLQMPGFDGLEVVRRVRTPRLPLIVFVTAHQQYAVNAFETHAIDYLLKPIARRRFQETLRRIREELAKEVAAGDAQRLHALKNTPGSRAEPPPIMRLAVRDRDRYVILAVNDVDWIESAGNYVQLHARGRVLLLRATMTELEQVLAPEMFTRIHRTRIVRIDALREILPSEHGDFTAVLHDGTQLPLSRNYRHRLFARTFSFRIGAPSLAGDQFDDEPEPADGRHKGESSDSGYRKR